MQEGGIERTLNFDALAVSSQLVKGSKKVHKKKKMRNIETSAVENPNERSSNNYNDFETKQGQKMYKIEKGPDQK